MSDSISHITVLSALIRGHPCIKCKLHFTDWFTQDWRFLSHFFHALFSIFAQCGRFCSKICPTERFVPKIHAFKQQKWKYPFRQGLLPNRCLSFAPFPGYCTLFIFRPSNSCPFKIIFQTMLRFPEIFPLQIPIDRAAE